MKQKINARLIFISVLAVLATAVGITLVYYQYFQEQVKRDLKTEARILSAVELDTLMDTKILMGDSEIRITWIDETGEVIYQSPEICPCEWYNSKDFGKAQTRGANLCATCLKSDCGLRDSALPW